jgi:hypothetical protein
VSTRPEDHHSSNLGDPGIGASWAYTGPSLWNFWVLQSETLSCALARSRINVRSTWMGNRHDLRSSHDATSFVGQNEARKCTTFTRPGRQDRVKMPSLSPNQSLNQAADQTCQTSDGNARLVGQAWLFPTLFPLYGRCCFGSGHHNGHRPGNRLIQPLDRKRQPRTVPQNGTLCLAMSIHAFLSGMDLSSMHPGRVEATRWV